MRRGGGGDLVFRRMGYVAPLFRYPFSPAAKGVFVDSSPSVGQNRILAHTMLIKRKAMRDVVADTDVDLR